MIECAPFPHDFPRIAFEFDDDVSHDLLPLARGVLVVLVGVVVVDFLPLGAEHDDVAVGQFVDLMVKGLRVHGDAGGGTFGTVCRVPLVDGIAQPVDLDHPEIGGDEDQVAVGDLFEIADARVDTVVPGDFAGLVKDHQHSESGIEIGDLLTHAHAPAPRIEERHAGLHSFRPAHGGLHWWELDAWLGEGWRPKAERLCRGFLAGVVADSHENLVIAVRPGGFIVPIAVRQEGRIGLRRTSSGDIS